MAKRHQIKISSKRGRRAAAKKWRHEEREYLRERFIKNSAKRGAKNHKQRGPRNGSG